MRRRPARASRNPQPRLTRRPDFDTPTEALNQTGKTAKAEQVIAERGRKGPPPIALSLAWICYRYQAYGQAINLFTKLFTTQVGNPNFLAALECAARRCGRVNDIVRLYKSQRSSDLRLFGRIRRLYAESGR